MAPESNGRSIIRSFRVTPHATAGKILDNALRATWRLESDDPSSYQRGVDEAVETAKGYLRYARVLTPRIMTETI